MHQHFEIVGSGLYLPRLRLTDEDIDRRAGLPAGWVRRHAGVHTRHECAEPETLSSMARAAATAALDDAGLGWRDLDLIVDGSACRQQPIPCNAACLQAAFGEQARGIPCFDVQSTCLGFVIALHLANGLFAAGAHRRILVVCSESGLAGVNWKEPESAALMGDGAAAVVLGRIEPTPTYFYRHETFSQHLDACQVTGGGHNLPPFVCTPQNEASYRFHMDGPRLFRAAFAHLPGLINPLIEQAEADRETLQVIPHQASPRAVEGVRRLLGFRPENYHNRAAELGNLAAASIPAVLHLCRSEGVVSRGQTALLLGTSAGYSQAGLIFRV
jgi:3-oxoacyl-[acyl-carrier-protein] synthase-3